MSTTFQELPPHQKRVVEEKVELDARSHKLIIFIRLNDTFKALPDAEQNRLQRQYDAMTQYSNVLGERIAAF